MDFDVILQITKRGREPKDFFDGKCPFCGKSHIIIRSSYKREIPDMGTPLEKVIVSLKVCLYYCQDCKATFTPEDPLFPPKLEYSRAILYYALMSFHYNNDSGETISKHLAQLHQVQVPAATIYSWLKEHSPNFLKARIEKQKPEDLAHLKTITVDGSYVHTGTAVIGKKKDVESLSVTKLTEGRYLLMWWE
jgi:hypothetical protein